MALLNTDVRYFDSTMSGAPTLQGVAGSAISVLDACLINGFGTVTVNGLVVSNNVATVTVSTGHNLGMIRGVNNVSPGVGPVIQIAGASPLCSMAIGGWNPFPMQAHLRSQRWG